MIRVQAQPEPDCFELRVRQPGLNAIALQVGKAVPYPDLPTRGKPIAQLKDREGKPITEESKIPSGKFKDYWTRVLKKAHELYGGRCAYTCFRIPIVEGAPTIDHMIPKSVDWRKAYEWDNYRLICSTLNGRKGTDQQVLDPFEVEDHWFLLNIKSLIIRPNPELNDELKNRIKHTIKTLRLNDTYEIEERDALINEYLEGDISLNKLKKENPYIHQTIVNLEPHRALPQHVDSSNRDVVAHYLKRDF